MAWTSTLGALAAVALMSGCASKLVAPPAPPVVERAALEELGRALAAGSAEYEEGIALIVAGDEVAGEKKIAAAEGILRRAAQACARESGCGLGPFLDALHRLLDRQGVALKSQSSRIATLEGEIEGLETAAQEVEREPGTSPYLAAVPEMERTETLLRGTDLRQLITLNGPVSAALEDWLTWLRPMILSSYDNYQFLRAELAPIYEEAGLPEALLFAMLATETGAKVHSFSPAGAAGPLQFMRMTGRRYGLNTVDGFDQRLDPQAATRAAVAYLNDRFAEFNDSLEKALAAYNGGESRVGRLHRKYAGTAFWDPRFYSGLPTETREYVPRILAAAWLYLHPSDYNLEFPELDGESTELALRQELSLGELAVCLGQAGNPNGWFRILRNLNPRLNPGERMPAGQSLRVPVAVVTAYEERCLAGEPLARARALHDAKYPVEPPLVTYLVRPRDTLAGIAARQGCSSARELAEINGVRPPRYTIHVGQALQLPRCD